MKKYMPAAPHVGLKAVRSTQPVQNLCFCALTCNGTHQQCHNLSHTIQRADIVQQYLQCCEHLLQRPQCARAMLMEARLYNHYHRSRCSIRSWLRALCSADGQPRSAFSGAVKVVWSPVGLVTVLQHELSRPARSCCYSISLHHTSLLSFPCCAADRQCTMRH
jgi:hypothetical protein